MKNLKFKNSFWMAILLILTTTPSLFAVNSSIGVEFYVKDSNGIAIEGDQAISLGLCDALSGGNCYCQASGDYTFDNGFLGTSLDCAADLDNLPDVSFLRLTIDGSTVSTEIQAVPYALSALSVAAGGTLSSPTITGPVTIAGDVTVTGSVTGGSFVGGGSGDITSVVAGSGLSGGGVTGDVTLTAVLGTTIDSSEIVDGTITAADIGADAVGSSEIAADAVGASEIATSAVTTTEILDGTIAAGDIANNTITGTQIANDNLDFPQFADSLTLDSNTTITQGSNTWTQTFAGAASTGFTLSSLAASMTSPLASFTSNVTGTGNTFATEGSLLNLTATHLDSSLQRSSVVKNIFYCL